MFDWSVSFYHNFFHWAYCIVRNINATNWRVCKEFWLRLILYTVKLSSFMWAFFFWFFLDLILKSFSKLYFLHWGLDRRIILFIHLNWLYRCVETESWSFLFRSFDVMLIHLILLFRRILIAIFRFLYTLELKCRSL